MKDRKLQGTKRHKTLGKKPVKNNEETVVSWRGTSKIREHFGGLFSRSEAGKKGGLNENSVSSPYLSLCPMGYIP